MIFCRRHLRVATCPVGNHRGQQLHHDGCADVRHDAQRKDGAISKRAAAEQIEEGGKTASGAAD
jgi:hypothetical protein